MHHLIVLLMAWSAPTRGPRPSRRCFRGPGAATWKDFTCEHPNAAGHDALYRMALHVIDE